MEEKNSKYYERYEQRYQAVYTAGGDFWGLEPDNPTICSLLAQWVQAHHLGGKKIIEFACGEGGVGKILTEMGCKYHGVDLAPSAVEAAKKMLQGCQNAEISRLDMVHERVGGMFDAALDMQGFHILITDNDRAAYLKNVYNCLKPGAPMLFYAQAYRENAYEGAVETYEQWVAQMGIDYEAKEKRFAKKGGQPFEVWIPRIAGRTKSERGYRREFEQAGFVVDQFIKLTGEDGVARRATIYVHKENKQNI